MQEKMRKTLIQVFLGVFLTAFLFCVLPQNRVSAAAGVQQISLGGFHSAALKTDGSLWMWGNNESGQLGNGGDSSGSTPTEIMTGVKAVSLGGYHSAALKADGSLWMWGANESGQLGNGSTKNSETPVKIMTGVKTVSLGWNYSAALKKDGSLWMWGANGAGQLGNGGTKNSGSPVKVMTGVKAVSLGGYHSAALKKDGSLWAWGANGAGQLGNGSTKNSSTPVKIMEGVRQISLGGSHSAALKTDGTLWTWGWNGYGQFDYLENGSDSKESFSEIPEKVMTGVKAVSLGWHHIAALKKDGSLWMWGNSEFGQLGINNIFSKTPVKVMTGVKQVSLGGYHSAALKADGSLWMWGNNGDSQLGNNSYTQGLSIPEQITLPASGSVKTNISECKITLSKKKYTYTGKAVKPLPTVKYNGKALKNKTDYTLTYENNKKAGTATIVIKGKGSYTGQKKITFTIQRSKK